MTEKEALSYKRIIATTSLVGFANAIGYLLELIKIKIAAILFGTTGIALFSSYQLLLKIIGTFTVEGLRNSGIHALSTLNKPNDINETNSLFANLRRKSIILSAIASIGIIACFELLNSTLFNNHLSTKSIILTAISIFILSLAGVNTSTLQGLRKTKEVAASLIISSIAATITSLVAFKIYGIDGIVISFTLTALASLFTTHYFLIKLGIRAEPSRQVYKTSHKIELFTINALVVASGLLTYLIDSLIRTIIINAHGFQQAGLYYAALSLASLYGGFIIGAMGVDYYPRISACINNSKDANHAINQQIEFGVLLGTPGIVFTIVFSSDALRYIYTEEFSIAGTALKYFAIGVFAKIVSWPLGFALLASKKAKAYLIVEVAAAALYLLLSTTLITRFGISGAGYAYLANFSIYSAIVYIVLKNTIGFEPAATAAKTIGIGLTLVLSALFSMLADSATASIIVGTALTLAASIFSARGIVIRLRHTHWLTKTILASKLRFLLLIP